MDGHHGHHGATDRTHGIFEAKRRGESERQKAANKQAKDGEQIENVKCHKVAQKTNTMQSTQAMPEEGWGGTCHKLSNLGWHVPWGTRHVAHADATTLKICGEPTRRGSCGQRLGPPSPFLACLQRTTS